MNGPRSPGAGPGCPTPGPPGAGGAAAIQLPDGRIAVGKTSELMGAAAAALLNALKALAGIGRKEHLITREAIEPIQALNPSPRRRR